jgi:hypothetical protein
VKKLWHHHHQGPTEGSTTMTTTTTEPATGTDLETGIREGLSKIAEAWHSLSSLVEPVVQAAADADPLLADVAALDPGARAIVKDVIGLLKERPAANPAAAGTATPPPGPAGQPG